MLRAMMMTLFAVFLVSPATSTRADEKEKPKKGRKPTLALRMAPREGFSPVSILFTAELKGGDDVEELYCPEVEWDWDDGSRSTQESDCDPWEEGKPLLRRFTNDHLFKESGSYDVRVTLLRLGKVLTTQTVRVIVRPGLGDPNAY